MPQKLCSYFRKLWRKTMRKVRVERGKDRTFTKKLDYQALQFQWYVFSVYLTECIK